MKYEPVSEIKKCVFVLAKPNPVITNDYDIFFVKTNDPFCIEEIAIKHLDCLACK